MLFCRTTILFTMLISSCGSGGGGGGGTAVVPKNEFNSAVRGIGVITDKFAQIRLSDGKVISANITGTNSNHQPIFSNIQNSGAENNRFSGLIGNSSDFLALSAVSQGSIYYAIGGTSSDPTMVGDVIFSGPVIITTTNGVTSEQISITSSIVAGTFSGSSNNFHIEGVYQGGVVSGTSRYLNFTGNLDADYYLGTAGWEMNGISIGNKNEYVGIFATTQQ